MQIRLKDWDRAALTWLFDISTGHADETSGGISRGFLHRAFGFVYRPREGAELPGVPHLTMGSGTGARADSRLAPFPDAHLRIG